MSILKAIEYQARLKMGNPSYDKVSPESLMEAIVCGVDLYGNMLENTDQNWLIQKGFFGVDATADEYALGGSLSNFSKAVRVEFYNEQNPAIRGPEIKMVNLQDVGLGGRSGAYTWALSQGVNDNLSGAYIASHIAFYNTPPTAVIMPKPTQPVTYRVYFQPMGQVRPKRMEEVYQIQAQYHSMLAYYGANERIGQCGYSPEVYQMYKRDIGEGLAKHEREFNQFRMTLKKPDTRKRRPYRPSRRMGFGRGGGYTGYGGIG